MTKIKSLVLVAAVLASGALAASSASAADMTLKNIMKQMGSAATNGDPKAMAPLFAKTKGLQPKDAAFAGWAALADKGKAAAEAGDLAGAKATCKNCHDHYRSDYKTKYGSKAP